MTGIALVSEYTASVCKDSGESAIAEKGNLQERL